MGEELNAADIAQRGLVGDRAYALRDNIDGKVATAKNPRKWPTLFDFRAVFLEPRGLGGDAPAVRITLPDGAMVASDQTGINQVLSKALGRDVRLARAEQPQPNTASAEEYWPDMDGLEHRDTVTDFSMPEGTFFDCATVHLLTTATLDRLRELYPQGRFEARRFRPNVVVEPGTGEAAFVENAWIGRTLSIGADVRLSVTAPCFRCVMTTLPQGDLPRDPGILRTAARHNEVRVGVYASVLQGGSIRRGDAVRMDRATAR